MFPSDTAGWIGFTLFIIVMLPLAAIALALTIDNTKALNEEKALRVELADMVRECDAIGPSPTDEQMAALNARIERYRQRFADFRASPFVISKPT